MNDKIIEQLLQYMNETKDFVLQECPEIFSQILSYEKWSCIFCLCIFIPILLVCLSLFIYTWMNPQYDSPTIFSARTFGTLLVCGILSFITFMIIIDCSMNLIKITTAPKYFIIQKIVNLKK